MAEQVVFPSKRDAWLTVLLLLAAGACGYAGFAQMFSAAGIVLKVALLVFFLVFVVLILWILYGTSYLLTAELLLVRSGPFRFVVPLAAIESAMPSRNPLSSPACSLDRLLICYGRKSILLSPVRREKFLQELASRGKNLVVQGDRVVKAG